MIEKEIERLKKENHFLKEIIAKIPGHIFWTDKENRFLGCNLAQARDAGLKRMEDIVGKTNYDMPWKGQADNLNKLNNKVMATGKTIIAEEPGTMVNGESFLFHSVKTPLRNKKGEIIGVLGVALDITERKAIEEELARVKQALEESNKNQLNLLNIVNHESRDPMNIILGTSQILLQENKEKFSSVKECVSFFRKHITHIYDYGKKLMGIINFVCDFVENEMIDEEIIKEEIELSSIIELLKKKYSEQLKKKPIQLKINIEKQVPSKLIVNTRRFVNVFDAVLNNAIKYTDKGKIGVKISGAPLDKSHFNLKVEIKDTGIGIKQEQLKHIFSHFDLNKEKTYMNSGLMLSATKQRLRMLDGNIEITSEPNKGTLVKFSLPVSYVQHLEKNKIQKEHRVLVIEDNVVASEVMANMLKYLGCQVDVANTGIDAIKMVQNAPKKYDIILLDIFLKDSYGYDIARELRPILVKNRTHIPLVAITANMTESDRCKCIDAGIEDISFKPISMQELQDILESHLN